MCSLSWPLYVMGMCMYFVKPVHKNIQSVVFIGLEYWALGFSLTESFYENLNSLGLDTVIVIAAM